MALFTPIWMKKGLNGLQLEKAKEQVTKLEGDKLVRAATEAPEAKIRVIAAEKLTDEAVLKRIALGDRDRGVRRAAAEKLTDGEALREIARNDEFNGKYAYDRLTGEIDQADYARNAKDPAVRRVALGKVTDQAELAQIALTERQWRDIREAAVSRLTVPTLTMDFYREYKTRFSRSVSNAFLAAMLGKLALAGDTAAVEELGGWLSAPETAEIAAEKLRGVYADTREKEILRYRGKYRILHLDSPGECDPHADESHYLHFDL